MTTQRAPQRRGPRLFVEGLSASVGGVVLLNEEDSHYTRDVLRLRLGEPLEIGDKASPKLFRARVGDLGERVSVELLEELPASDGASREISLLFALCKGEKNDLVCDWATELGCRQIIFWQAERSVVRLRSPDDAESKRARFTKIAQAAAQQSKQACPPSISVALSLQEALLLLGKKEGSVRITCSLAESALPFERLLGSGPSATVIAIGPEGDFTTAEDALLSASGFTQGSLGPSTLRSELAAVTALCLARR